MGKQTGLTDTPRLQHSLRNCSRPSSKQVRKGYSLHLSRTSQTWLLYSDWKMGIFRFSQNLDCNVCDSEISALFNALEFFTTNPLACAEGGRANGCTGITPSSASTVSERTNIILVLEEATNYRVIRRYIFRYIYLCKCWVTPGAAVDGNRRGTAYRIAGSRGLGCWYVCSAIRCACAVCKRWELWS